MSDDGLVFTSKSAGPERRTGAFVIVAIDCALIAVGAFVVLSGVLGVW